MRGLGLAVAFFLVASVAGCASAGAQPESASKPQVSDHPVIGSWEGSWKLDSPAMEGALRLKFTKAVPTANGSYEVHGTMYAETPASWGYQEWAGKGQVVGNRVTFQVSTFIFLDMEMKNWTMKGTARGERSVAVILKKQ